MSAEKEISLLEVCFYILRKWKQMIICAMIAAIATAVFTYAKSSNDFEINPQIAMEETLAEIGLSGEDKKDLETKMTLIDQYQKNIADIDYYLDNSIRMRLNPNSFYQGTIKYVFATHDSESIMKAKTLCDKKILDDDIFKELSLQFSKKTDWTLLKEVVFVEGKIFEADSDFNMEYTVTVQHYNREDCESMLAFFENEITAVLTSITTQFITEKIISDIQTTSDYELMTFCHELNTEKYEAYDNIELLKKAMSSEQKEYYTLLNSMDNIDGENTSVVVKKSTIEIRAVGISLIATIFLVACVYGVIYMFDSRIHTKEEVESWLSYPVYEYELASEKKKNIIDTAISVIKKRAKSSAQDTPEMIAAMVLNLAEQKKVKKVYLTGSAEEHCIDTMNNIKALLSKRNVEVVIGKSILKDTKTLQQAVDCGSIVFVEKCEVSLEKNIRSEISKACTCGIAILGIILES